MITGALCVMAGFGRCGRPLTEEAWAELERRFFGEV